MRATALGVGGLTAVALLVAGVLVARRDRLGTWALAGYLWLVGGGAGLLLLGVWTGVVPTTAGWPGLARLAAALWVVSVAPWTVFALRYTGQYTRLGPRVVGTLLVPHVGFLLQIVLSGVSGVGRGLLAQFGSALFVYTFGLVVVGSFLLVRTTRRYGTTSGWHGIALALPAVGSLFVWDQMRFVVGSGAGRVTSVFTLGLLLVALGVAVAVGRGAFDTLPATGVIGEREIVGETDDRVVVVDTDDRIVSVNDAAVETLADSREALRGGSIADAFGHDTRTLRDRETVTLPTSAARFDPQVSEFTDPAGRRLGSVVSLRDVTDRELREQRLSVYNRVLRHNLRNSVDVIRAHAEASENPHATAITDAADELAALGEETRAAERLVTESREASVVDLASLVPDVIDARSDEAVVVTSDTPETARLTTDRLAVESAVENAVAAVAAHAESRVTVTVRAEPAACVVTVAGDGSGIPRGELDALAAEEETALRHTTGLRLWRLNWAVRTAGGDLTFDPDDGTTLTVRFPDQSDT